MSTRKLWKDPLFQGPLQNSQPTVRVDVPPGFNLPVTAMYSSLPRKVGQQFVNGMLVNKTSMINSRARSRKMTKGKR